MSARTSLRIAMLRCLTGITILPLLVSAVQSTRRRFADGICLKDNQKALLGDLVAAELSNVKGLELVERDELESQTKELQLLAFADSEAAGTRRKLGATLRADALLILSTTRMRNGTALKIVVSECQLGARLRVVHLPYGAKSAGELSHRCVEVAAGASQASQCDKGGIVSHMSGAASPTRRVGRALRPAAVGEGRSADRQRAKHHYRWSQAGHRRPDALRPGP